MLKKQEKKPSFHHNQIILQESTLVENLKLPAAPILGTPHFGNRVSEGFQFSSFYQIYISLSLTLVKSHFPKQFYFTVWWIRMR